MSLLELLENLICRDHLLSFLQLNDFLRLRRVCKYCKSETEDFILTQKIQSGKQLKISLNNENRQQLIDYQKISKYLPMWRSVHFCMLNFEDTTLGRLGVPLEDFLETNAANITHLSLSKIQIPFYSTKLLQFLESFPNLAHLTMEDFTTFDDPPDDDQAEVPTEVPRIPSSFTKLKTLIVGCSDPLLYRHFLADTNICTFLINLVDTCIPNLEKLSFPFEQFLSDDEWLGQALSLACRCLFGAPRLKLMELHWEVIEELLRMDNRTPEMSTVEDMKNSLNLKLMSVLDPFQNAPLQEFPNLEQIDFPNLCYFRRGDWPQLKVIRANFHIVRGDWILREAWNILFGGGGIVRENVVKLIIKFWDFEMQERIFPRTRVIDIGTSCTNLKILCIGALRSERVAISQLWRGLPHLEQLHFEPCHRLRDSDFIGEDDDALLHPALFTLKNLKVLTFKDTRLMEVTDRFFTNVLCQMPLKELSMLFNSECDVRFTLEGIRSLLKGEFASTIERLSMELDHVPKEELNHVISLFRSSQMI